ACGDRPARAATAANGHADHCATCRTHKACAAIIHRRVNQAARFAHGDFGLRQALLRACPEEQAESGYGKEDGAHQSFLRKDIRTRRRPGLVAARIPMTRLRRERLLPPEPLARPRRPKVRLFNERSASMSSRF